MNIGKIIRKALHFPDNDQRDPNRIARKKPRYELDIYFTENFSAKAKQWGLTEDHARLVFYEGDIVKQNGKPTNMKVLLHKGEEIGIYVFRDRDTNQPVITSIWKRRFRAKSATSARR